FSLHLFLLSLIIRRPPISPLFPYTTLFRSGIAALSVATSGGKVISVTTTSGDVHPGAVVFATGIPPLLDGLPIDLPATKVKGHRSEEHTSELQSLTNLVCRLLLEKKKKQTQ